MRRLGGHHFFRFIGEVLLGTSKRGRNHARARRAGAATLAALVFVSNGAFAQELKPHRFTLSECLALADQNAPQLAAMRAQLDMVHSQLEEARWAPYFNWTLQVGGGVLPPITGTPFYTSSTASALSTQVNGGIQPFLRVDLNGNIPIYTFGKIEGTLDAAKAQVRVKEWDVERIRLDLRRDVRRAYYGLMFARDAAYLAEDVRKKLEAATGKMKEKLDRGDKSIDEVDKMRLDFSSDALAARTGDIGKGEKFALAALRFLTGVQSRFDIVDEPLTRIDKPVGHIVRYLTAARLYRPDVNMARAGINGRRALLHVARARMLPDIGLALFGGYGLAPSAVQQDNPWIADNFNRFGAGFAFGLRWSLDILPAAARAHAAESALDEVRAQERAALGWSAVEVENAHATALEAQNREEVWGRAEKRAKEWIATVENAIDLGTKDERHLLEPLQRYVDARFNHMQALMDLNVAAAELGRATGFDEGVP